jgi:hypothetical protein
MTDRVAVMNEPGSSTSPSSNDVAVAARPNTAILQKVRDAGLAGATTLFKHALDASDDALFGFSEKSDSATERGQYMDAMRAMRLGRPALEQAFRDQLANRFLEFSRGKSGPGSALGDSFDSDALSLVEENDLEEDLAVNGMVAKAVVRHHSAL